MTPTWQVITGDCLDVLPTLAAGSVDAIITDLPYGTTACSWDEVIPFAPMWAQVKRLLKPRGAFVTTASQPFTSKLVMSNLGWFKYEWTWIKNRPTGAQHSKNRPMVKHENIVVFSPAPMGHVSLLGDSRMAYTPLGIKDAGVKVVKEKGTHGKHIGARPNQVGRQYISQTGFPNTILKFSKEESHIHTSQKPVALYEYLIRTYTNEGDTVLDFTCGSGTTGVACVQTGRNFIGIELDPGYADIARARIANAAEQARQLELI